MKKIYLLTAVLILGTFTAWAQTNALSFTIYPAETGPCTIYYSTKNPPSTKVMQVDWGDGIVKDYNDVATTGSDPTIQIYGTVNPTIPAIPHLRKTKGSIIFISSLAGIRGLPGLSAYCSSKMALRAIAESIRIEEKSNDIHVGLIYVGITEIEHNKETIASDGSMKVLKDRSASKVQTTSQVAQAVLQNIKKRKFITTLTGIGKVNKFMQPRFPLLVEKIILKSLHKFEEKSE